MNQTTKDPRACKIPMTEFNHLSIGEIRELARLERLESRFTWGSDTSKRWFELRRRRVDPDRGHNKGNAA